MDPLAPPRMKEDNACCSAYSSRSSSSSNANNNSRHSNSSSSSSSSGGGGSGGGGGGLRSTKRVATSLLRSLFGRMVIVPCWRLTLPAPEEEEEEDAATTTLGASPLGGGGVAVATGRQVTGTLFGSRRGHVHLALQQEGPSSSLLLLLELSTPTAELVRDMASGLVRIALECRSSSKGGEEGAAAAASGGGTQRLLLEEPVWRMYSNGRRAGYALRRNAKADRASAEVLRLLSAVSMGAGVLPASALQKQQQGSKQQQHQQEQGKQQQEEVMYMRARFQRVVASNQSEALYMINPDRTGSPELSIFFLRV